MSLAHRRRLRHAASAALAAALVLAASAQAATVTKVAIPLEAGDYRYQQTPHGGLAGFEAPGFDDSGWATGAAGFGNLTFQCSFSHPEFISTNWDPNTDMLLRRSFTLPAGATNVRVLGTVDNDATVYVNGTQIGFTSTGFCNTNTIDFVADPSTYHAGSNLLAVRAHDFGGSTYIDQRVLYDVPAYAVCALYDPAKSHRSGSTVPLKFQLCDENGANVSAPSLAVNATGLRHVDSASSGVVEDSGNANPGDDFRYDPDLAGYVFNKSTKGLAGGTWELSFSVDGESQPAYTLRFDVR